LEAQLKQSETASTDLKLQKNEEHENNQKQAQELKLQSN